MATKSLKIGDIQIAWLDGGAYRLDGGAMFGPVPKTLWSKLYPADKDNCIQLHSSPLLIRTPDKTIIVETGIGNTLTDRQRKLYKVERPWNLLDGLAENGVKREDIDFIILTHCDFDHAGGMVMREKGGDSTLTFPNARYCIQRLEWEDTQAPNVHKTGAEWSGNFQELTASRNLDLIDGDREICRGVGVLHTGGHTRGHQIVRVSSKDQTAYYLSDLLPTHIHSKPLWITANDHYPLEVIQLKEDLQKRILSEEGWILFYHDPFLNACRFDVKGDIIDRWPPQQRGDAEGRPVQQKSAKTQRIDVRNAKDLNIGCPHCTRHRRVPVDKFMGKKHFLNVKCTCGNIFGVELNFRQHFRKEVTIGGYYREQCKDKLCFSETGGIPSTPINCEIKNISRGGIGFSPFGSIKIKKGDMITVSFTLNKQPPEFIEKEAEVKSVRENYIGCEFTSASSFDRSLGFFLMK